MQVTWPESVWLVMHRDGSLDVETDEWRARDLLWDCYGADMEEDEIRDRIREVWL